MKTVIYYYTGTGNSLWTARTAAGHLGAELVSMTAAAGERIDPGAEAVGLAFPVHMWGVPAPVISFLDRLVISPSVYYFAFGVNAGQVSRTLVQLGELVAARGGVLAAGFDVVLPSNYIPWGGPGPREKLDRLFAAAEEKLAGAAAVVARRESGRIEKGPLWQRIVFTALYRMTGNRIATMDRGFWVDEKCTGCGICAKVCPAANIVIESKRPAWLHHCEQCLACIQWCPEEALQYGKKTPAYERYRHPQVKLAEIISRVG